MSRRQFGDLFRKVTGQNWRQYVLVLRLQHAAELLTETDHSVSSVAFESGFEDLSNFHHCFKAAHGCSPLAYREQRCVRLPAKIEVVPPSLPGPPSSRFKFRGMKGWSWTTDQYLEEIPVLAGLKLNFLMNCYRSLSVSRPGEPWCNEWWKPMAEERRKAYEQIIRRCYQNNINFCLALHPQLSSPRLLDPGNAGDIEAFLQHYIWAQRLGVKWFSICLDDTIWGASGPAACGASHAALVNTVFGRLQIGDADAQMVFCPAAYWGDGSNPEHHAYLAALANRLDPDVYVFWNGDAIVTPRITRMAAESYKNVVQHRLFLWDNYPVNDANPTMHLGPLSGRELGLCDVIEGYLSNAMCSQNQINRIPLATCADYASNPTSYSPARSIGQAILRFGKTEAQRQTLKELIEAYPGFIVAGGGTGTNPVRARFGVVLERRGPRLARQEFISRIDNLSARMAKVFPGQFQAARKTLQDDLRWMKEQLGGTE